MALSDNDLIIQAKSGNPLAFEELIYRHDKMVLRLALKYFNDVDVAKDIYQEVFIRVYRGLNNFQFKSEFSTWLFRIASNVCLNYKRIDKQSKHISIDPDEENETVNSIPADDTFSPEQQLLNKDFGEQMNLALKHLSPNQKMSFLLKHYEGYKIREIAEMMNCKEGTVKKYIFEAVRKLRNQLGEFNLI